MKINKFLENNNNLYNYKPNKNFNEVTYTLYGEIIFSKDKYKEYNLNSLNDVISEICSGTIQYCLKLYEIHYKKYLKGDIGSYDSFFIIKKEVKNEVISDKEFNKLLDEYKLHLDVNKFNL